MRWLRRCVHQVKHCSAHESIFTRKSLFMRKSLSTEKNFFRCCLTKLRSAAKCASCSCGRSNRNTNARATREMDSASDLLGECDQRSREQRVSRRASFTKNPVPENLVPKNTVPDEKLLNGLTHLRKVSVREWYRFRSVLLEKDSARESKRCDRSLPKDYYRIDSIRCT